MCHSRISYDVVFVVCTAVGIGSAAKGADQTTYALQSACRPGHTQRVKATLDLDGELKVPGEKGLESVPIRVVGNLAYDERLVRWDPSLAQGVASIRHYDRADAVIEVEGTTAKRQLRQQRRLIGAEVGKQGATLFSPQGQLTREELDLVDVVGNSLLFDLLLPKGPVKVGETWEHSKEVVALLLGLEEVADTDLRSVLLEVNDREATLQLSGTTEGAIGGVTSRIAAKAKYMFDFRAKRVTRLGMAVREQREIGHAAPGLEVTARLQMTIVPSRQSPHLTDRVVAELPTTPTAELETLVYRPVAGGCRLAHDRRWFVAEEDPRSTVMRMIDRGELVAQCNIAWLPRIAVENLPTLRQFQEQVEQGLGKNFGQFVKVGQWASGADYRVFRAIVDGQAAELPIRWVYYFLADQYGHQAALVFTVEGNLVERFGDADRLFIETLSFTEEEDQADPDGSQPDDGGLARRNE